MNYIFGLIIIVSLVILEAKTADLPKSFRTCDRRSTEFLRCTSEAAVDAIHSMANGLKSFKIAPLEPLQVGDVIIGKKGGAVSVQQSYKNAKLYGLTKGLKINHTLIDFEKLIIRSDDYNDRVDFTADYVMDGRVLLLPINGKGQSNVTMIGLKSKNTIYCEKYEKNGEIYLRVKRYECKFNPAKVLLNFTNLFNGDPLISKQLNIFLNENAQLVFDETREEYEETFGLVFAKIANDFFSRVPMSKIFPE